MPSTSGPRIQSTVLTHLHYYDETDFNEGKGLKDLQTEMAALKSLVSEQFSIIKRNIKLNCDHLKPVLKSNPEFILYIGSDNISKYTPNEIVDKVLALKRFVIGRNEKWKVISTLTIGMDSSKNGNKVQKVNEILKGLSVPLVKNFNTVR